PTKRLLRYSGESLTGPKKPPAPHIRSIRSLALARDQRRRGCVEIIGRHPDARIPRHHDLELEEHSPELAQCRVGSFPLLNPVDRLTHEAQHRVSCDPE